MIEWKSNKFRDNKKEWSILYRQVKPSPNKKHKWKKIARFDDPELAKRVAKLLTNQEEWKEESKNLEEPSDEFKKAVLHTSSTGIDCELCDRFHFTDEERNAGEYTDKEWEELLKKAELSDKFFYHYYDYIEWGTVDGKQVVLNCPCNRATRYERWIISHRHIIIDFLKARAKNILTRAGWEADLVGFKQESLRLIETAEKQSEKKQSDEIDKPGFADYLLETFAEVKGTSEAEAAGVVEESLTFEESERVKRPG